MIKRRLFKFATVVLMVAMTMSFSACSKNGNASNEPTTQTDILAVEIVDKDGNKHTIKGVGVTDESGKTTITVTDKDGNKTVIEGTATKDEDGKTTVTGGTVVQGGTITKEDGTTIDTNGSKVEDVVDNNDGKIDTDVSVDETTKAEVESKKEEATKEQATKTDIANKETEKATEKETAASKETEGQTQAPTVKPTEAPTQKPMTEEEKAIAECLKNSDFQYDSSKDEYYIFYKGSAEKVICPATYNGKTVSFFEITANNHVKEVVVLGANTMSHFQNSHKLEKITTYANMIDTTLISTCSKIKEVNLLGDNITFIQDGFVQYHSLTYPTDFSGATLNINLKKIDDVMTCGHPVYLPDTMVTVSEYCAKYSKLVQQYGLDYTFFNRDWTMTGEYKNWFSKINYLK
ncbi:MAG: hypothetical protein IJB96_03445 [Lachnospira sp.]|nr:hypothetical protein [Lachnospira sp.]